MCDKKDGTIRLRASTTNFRAIELTRNTYALSVLAYRNETLKQLRGMIVNSQLAGDCPGSIEGVEVCKSSVVTKGHNACGRTCPWKEIAWPERSPVVAFPRPGILGMAPKSMYKDDAGNMLREIQRVGVCIAYSTFAFTGSWSGWLNPHASDIIPGI